MKTTDKKYGNVEQAIREHHSYELPAIHVFAMAAIYGSYAAWLYGNCDAG